MCVLVVIDAKLWLDMSRARVVIAGFSPACGGIDAANWFRAQVDDCKVQRALTPPTPIFRPAGSTDTFQGVLDPEDWADYRERLCLKEPL